MDIINESMELYNIMKKELEKYQNGDETKKLELFLDNIQKGDAWKEHRNKHSKMLMAKRIE